MAQETVVVQSTGQHTHSLLAPLVVGTVVVAVTAEHADAVIAPHALGASGIVDASVWHPNTFDFRISGERGWAGADLGVVGRLALGIDATSVPIVAGILAAAAEADLR